VAHAASPSSASGPTRRGKFEQLVVRALSPTFFRPTSWRRKLHVGVNRVLLRISPKVRAALIRRPGPYVLTWMATSTATNDQAGDAKRVLVVPPKTHR
jgi:hypothetical protein